MKNLILHGFSDNDISRVLRDKVIDTFENIIRYEEAGVNFHNAIVYTRRLGREVGQRPVLVEFANPCYKRVVFEWKSELEGKGIRIVNGYSKEERQEYARFKKVKNDILKKTGEIAILRKGKIVMKRRGILSFEDAEKIAEKQNNELDTSTSPQLGDDGKRRHAKEPREQEKKRNKPGSSDKMPGQMEIDQFYGPQRRNQQQQ